MMADILINIGFGSTVSVPRIVCIVSPDSSPVKRLIVHAKESGRLIDATHGRRTRAVIVTDSDHVILSAIQAETVAQRINTNEQGQEMVEGDMVPDSE
jgi:hypothetical protein